MRILVVRIGRAGDIVMTTPALSAIFDNYPGAEVTMLTSPDGRRLLKNFHPNLRNLWVWNRSGFHGYFDKRKIMKKLATNSFDIIFCFDTSKRIASLFENTSATFIWQETLNSSKHCALNYLDTVEQASGSLKKAYYSHLHVDNAEKDSINKELLKHGIAPDDTVIMLHPSFSGYSNNPIIKFLKRNNRSFIHRLWPAENFAKLGDMIASLKMKNGKSPKVIIDLIPEEAPLGQEVIDNCNNSIKLLQARPNFERYKALISRADLLIAPNTGPMHIAAAVGTKVIALFSDWKPIDCGPYMDPTLFKIIRAEDMNQPEQGLSAISPENVIDACKRLLS